MSFVLITKNPSFSKSVFDESTRHLLFKSFDLAHGVRKSRIFTFTLTLPHNFPRPSELGCWEEVKYWFVRCVDYCIYCVGVFSYQWSVIFNFTIPDQEIYWWVHYKIQLLLIRNYDTLILGGKSIRDNMKYKPLSTLVRYILLIFVFK